MSHRLLALLASSAAVALATTAASAADLPSRRAPAPVVAAAPLFTWTGFYAGVNAGYTWGDNTMTLSSVDPDFFAGVPLAGFGRSKNEGSFTGGGQIGYNYQIGSAVLGLETDLNYVNLNDRYALTFADAVDSAILEARHKVQWFGTLRARLGFTPAERLLVYATGGLAYGSVKTNTGLAVDTADMGSGAFSASKSDTRWGWALGAGAEYAVTNNLTLKAEYLYVDLDSKNLSATSPQFPGVSYNVKDETSFHTLRAGLNYKFNSY
ncbi:outer membrane immunogenic protein [Microvirga flocculans]|uniref:Outer membrane immunogenic protein n=1 Tax=Microvirga flocculans TaxID=217168 RepID=A0A7W6N8J7_9HYPH|nr:outer membrane protein [Microvirga flocculans]MBB4040458.1 outer membrane immunogenic protein [Microvirga flocculans]